MPDVTDKLGRRLPGQALRISVSRHAISVVRTSRWGRAPQPVVRQAFSPEDAAAHHDQQALGIALRDVLSKLDTGGWPVHFVLADELVRMWQVTPPAQSTRLADIEAAAALRFFALYGEAASGWHIAGDWDTRAPFFAAAIPRPLLAMLGQVAQEHGMALVAVEPQVVAAWNHWRRAIKPGAWFGQVHDGLLALGIAGNGRLRAVRTLPLPAAGFDGNAHAWLTQTIQREALLAGVDVPQLVQLCGEVPPLLAKPAGQDQTPVAMLGAALPGEVMPGECAA
ncbi:hypothetical protein GCM10027277_48080 [Pseudoduganella ginsengisoli]|uniref:Uncharacterized protein n=1 Tax=Pseudoduganella ginsengisoli TaxID=1462440 RepID=A0A6L6Q2A3_9BURK|nr:hypothetical protein [Pseudoduganella ginsengisoli]MTW04003.1 hypothetical protein [Pseudoduganella ginsengisoli]